VGPERGVWTQVPVRRAVDLGFARVSTAKQDLDRQVDALQQAGVAPERIYLDRKSGATTDRPGLTAALAYARAGESWSCTPSTGWAGPSETPST
jgi:predicted site-specific integrase-resolvase